MKQTRILHFIPAFNYGGIETIVMNIYRNIKRDKVQFDFLIESNVENKLTEEIKNLGGRIYRLPKYNRKNIIKYYSAIDKFFKENADYEIIHAHTITRVPILFYIAKKNGIKNRIFHAHTTKFSEHMHERAYKRIITNLNIRLSTELFACSKAAGEYYFKKNNIPKVKIINNAINIEKYLYNEFDRNKIRNELNFKSEFIIGNIGRLMPQKNHSYLIDIFYDFSSIFTNTKLVLVGDGDLEKELKQKVSSLSLDDKVLFLSHRNDVNKILSALDILVMPSHTEGLPLVVVEAQAAGLPVLASDNITEEVKITDLVEFLPCEKSTTKWCNLLLKYASKVNYRRDNTKEITQNGFNASESAKILEEIYMNMLYKNR